MKTILKEFRDFALRGNAINLAVGVLIGAAFQSIVKSLTDNIISPILGLFGGLDFNQYTLDIGNVKIGYGAFITAVINFLITASVVFLIVKFMNAFMNLHKKKAAPTVKTCPFCKSEIKAEATRCPHCTSELAADEGQDEGWAGA
jgi:large conductance mechanosensitive channel